MAEEDSAQEKSEEPTSRKLEKAREEGQVPRSRELTTSAVLLVGTIGLWVFGAFMAQKLLDIMSWTFSIPREAIFDTNSLVVFVSKAFSEALFLMFPIFGVLLVAAIAGPIALGGFLWSNKALAPKLNRMDPIAGLKRMFSAKSLMELIKAIGKVSVVIAASYVFLVVMAKEVMGLSEEGLEQAIIHSLELSMLASIVISASTIMIVLIDVPFQIWEHMKKLKMSLQDIKDEMKDTDGRPEVKARIRQLQQEMANNRMMESVPNADVVITNPTHYSVALKYDPDTMDTPVLLAKGVDHMAMKIREVARANKIEFVESPPLARAIYHTTDVDEEVPSGLYVAVAQVLAYVFQLRNFRKGRGQKPVYPKNIDLPPDMNY